jgi:hypothetical protein
LKLQKPKILEKSTLNSRNGEGHLTRNSFLTAKLFLRAMILGKAVFLGGEVSPVQSIAEAQEVLKLLYREYLKKSLCRENRIREHYSVYSFIRNSTILTLKKNGLLLGTLMAIEDGPHKLPADELYGSELDSFRSSGNKLAEVGLLALDSRSFKSHAYSLRSFRKLRYMMSLFNGLFNFLYQSSDCTHIVIMVNPRHTEIYKLYGFRQFSDVRHYDKVDKPAVPMIQDFESFLSSADSNVFALSVVKTMKLMGRIRKFHFSPSDIAQKIENNAPFFDELSGRDEAILLAEYPELSEIYRLNKVKMLEKSSQFVSDTDSLEGSRGV